MRRIIIVVPVLLTLISCNSKSKDVQVITIEEFTSTINKTRQKEKPTVYNFWATWCAPCIAEMPLIEQFALKHELNLKFVNVDRKNLWETRVPRMLKKLNLQSEVYLLDKAKRNNWYQAIDENWKAGLPVTLFTGRDKKVLYQGVLEEEDLLEITNKFNEEFIEDY
ncbi:MAG: hypothetical protein CMC18_06725 [Flavobacteriaceae bacterium]|nr:hypothetical protein [Flavobacteriaceae bacterium]